MIAEAGRRRRGGSGPVAPRPAPASIHTSAPGGTDSIRTGPRVRPRTSARASAWTRSAASRCMPILGSASSRSAADTKCVRALGALPASVRQAPIWTCRSRKRARSLTLASTSMAAGRASAASRTQASHEEPRSRRGGPGPGPGGIEAARSATIAAWSAETASAGGGARSSRTARRLCTTSRTRRERASSVPGSVVTTTGGPAAAAGWPARARATTRPHRATANSDLAQHRREAIRGGEVWVTLGAGWEVTAA